MKNITYTKTGDKGETSLIGGKRVPKYDDRVEAYGAVDELSAFIGVLSDLDQVPESVRSFLEQIQYRLLTVESHFALDAEAEMRKNMPRLAEEDVMILEKRIDEMNAQLPELSAFVLPGGNLKASYCHVCRTVARRAERQAWRMASAYPVDELNLRYLNRLSDFFFVLGRFFVFADGNVEVFWETDK